MRRLISVFVVVWALLAVGTASAIPLDEQFPQFAGELHARLDNLPATGLTKAEKKQKATIKKALAALAVDPADISKAIKSVRKAIVATDAAFPADATLEPIEAGVVGRFAADVLVRNGYLVRSIQNLADGTLPRTRAQAKSDDAGAKLAASQTAATRAEQLTLMASAVTAIVSGEKIVKKAGGTVGPSGEVVTTMVDADINTTANHLHLPGVAPPFGTYVVVYESSLDRLMLTASGSVNGQPVTFIIAVPGHGTGTRELPILGPSVFNSPGVTPPPAPAVSGSMTFTTWDLEGRKMAGTFDVTFSNGITTIHVMNGVFSTLELSVL